VYLTGDRDLLAEDGLSSFSDVILAANGDQLKVASHGYVDFDLATSRRRAVQVRLHNVLYVPGIPLTFYQDLWLCFHGC
jgi:hypothetical protein